VTAQRQAALTAAAAATTMLPHGQQTTWLPHTSSHLHHGHPTP
jgi:hypothetical protein